MIFYILFFSIFTKKKLYKSIKLKLFLLIKRIRIKMPHKKKQSPLLTKKQQKEEKKKREKSCEQSKTPQQTTSPVPPKKKKATQQKPEKKKTGQVKCSKCPTEFKTSSKKETLCASCKDLEPRDYCSY
jgi:hypothetical protein